MKVAFRADPATVVGSRNGGSSPALLVGVVASTIVGEDLIRTNMLKMQNSMSIFIRFDGEVDIRMLKMDMKFYDAVVEDTNGRTGDRFKAE